MPTEIERKFLVTDASWRNAVISRSSLTQAYLMRGDDRSVRIRIENGESARLCVKVGASALVRAEFEYPVPLADAREMVALATGIVIEKTRHRVHFQGYLWEIDAYHGVYEGLTVAEVELESVDDHPPLPAWAGLEVTGDRRYSNANLSTADLSGELRHGPSS
ncbi:CYTH domain-containing protein [Rhizobiaceae bacterium BDR2-2]|uniref:CYTH domain-containing protein n=1 Tax=Ectorhizobium quercum TaxID=2965071 RepID=A0AAE3SUA9_9HYPH|nr:CYTH domain-containing protein [Ectorhizobium quercum]MCX8996877.1 CYTH domain-containing protein [Ectorhizobium quercum]